MKIKSKISTQSDDYKKNHQEYMSALETYQKLIDRAEHGGGEHIQDRLREQGKLTPRERIEKLKDPGTEFLELSKLAGHELYESEVIAGGTLTGVALIHGRPCMVVANDPSVKGGSYYPITAKKHLRAQEIAAKNKLPCIYLVDSGGAFLPKQAEVFPDRDHFGRVFYNQARMSAEGIPQIASVHGFCTAGGAYIPAMADQSIIVEGTGSIFLGGPPLVKAATGEDVTAQELGGADVHTRMSGVADHYAKDDAHALATIRQIIARLKPVAHAQVATIKSREPAYPIDEVLGIMPADSKTPFDIREIIARIVDGSELFEFKPEYGKTLITGFARLGGVSVGIIANNGILFSESSLKGTHFIELCCAENTPILFLQNITGFMVGKEYEQKGIAKDGAKLVHAVANANVPKLTLVVGGSFGAGNYGMCGRAYDPNFMFMWPRSRISVMGGEQAAQVLITVKQDQLAKQGKPPLTDEQIEEIKRPIVEKYEREGSAYYATARLWDDGVIDPRNTRKVLMQALAATLAHQWAQTKNGIFRM